MSYKPGYGRWRGKIIKRSETHKESIRAKLRRNMLPARAGLSTELRNWRLFRGFTQQQGGAFFHIKAAEISVWERDGVPNRRVPDVRYRLEVESSYYGVSFADCYFRSVAPGEYIPAD